MKNRILCKSALILCIVMLSLEMPALAQDEQSNSRIATSSVGRAGQRQTREEVLPNVQPMARISNRINNRVQSRIASRIDRNYVAQANATSSIEDAQNRAGSGTPR